MARGRTAGLRRTALRRACRWLRPGDPLPPDRPILALDPDGDDFDPRAVPAGALLAFGSERHGLSAEVRAAADRSVRLPMQQGVSSMNLATSVAAVLYAPRLCS